MKRWLIFTVLMAVLSLATVVSAETTISYWIWDPNQVEGTEQMIERFESTHDIKVDLLVIPWGEYWDKVPIALAGGVGPDVYWMTMYNFGMMRDGGMILNLQPYLDRDSEARDNFDSMWPVLRSAYVHDGDAYGFPRDYDTVALLYNADAVDDAGLAPPKAIEDVWTWKDLTQYAQRLTVRNADDVSRWGYRSISWGQQYWYNFIRANGGNIFDAAGAAGALNQPEAIEAIQYMVDLRHVYEVAHDGWDGEFVAGTAAMENNGSWALKGYVGVTGFEWDVAELPASPNTGNKSSVIHGLANVINPRTPQVDAAFAFAKFLASQEAQLILGASGTVIPSREDSAAAWFSPDLYPSNRMAFQRAVAYADPYPSSPYIGRDLWQAPLDEFVNQALTGTISVREAMMRADHFLDAVLAYAMQSGQ